MRKFTNLVAATALVVTFVAPGLAAASEYSEFVLTDRSMRVSKIIGATVYNDQGQNVGKIMEVLVKSGAAEPIVAVSVGGNASAAKMVAVLLSHLNLEGTGAKMAGTSGQTLASMPTYLFPPFMATGG